MAAVYAGVCGKSGRDKLGFYCTHLVFIGIELILLYILIADDKYNFSSIEFWSF